MKETLISKIFGKNIEELNLDDIKLFFQNKQQEGPLIEFKSGEVEINDLYNEVAAFLNTEGGIIIVGAPKECKERIGNTLIRFCQGDLTYSKFSSKEWLLQKIYTNITPSPIGISIQHFLTNDGNIFILEIPQSFNPPHQSNNSGKYYIRLESDAKAAPHGLVSALFDKRRKPLLSPDLITKEVNHGEDEVIVSLRNLTSTPAEKVFLIIDVYNCDVLGNEFELVDDDILGQKYSCSLLYDQVLVKVIHLRTKFNVSRRLRNYIVSVGYWSLHNDFDIVFFFINPSQQIIEKKELNLLDPNLKELIDSHFNKE